MDTMVTGIGELRSHLYAWSDSREVVGGVVCIRHEITKSLLLSALNCLITTSFRPITAGNACFSGSLSPELVNDDKNSN